MGYVPALDGIRALAITSVVAYHALGVPRAGNFGVDLFFVLSGFLITTILLDKPSLRQFYARRARRLLPALVLMLAVMSAAVGLLPVLAGLGYFSNILLLGNAQFPDALSHLWSLAQEEQFYMVWPVLLFLVPRRFLPTLIVAGIVASTSYAAYLSATSEWQRVYYDPLAHATPILVGCVLAFVPLRRTRIGRYGGPVVLLAFLVSDETAPLLPGALLIVGLAAAALIVEAMHESRTAWLLGLAPLAFLGRISYSLYLWHMPVLMVFGAYQVVSWRTPVAITVSFALATLSYYVVERPFLRRGRPAVTRPSQEPQRPLALQPA